MPYLSCEFLDSRQKLSFQITKIKRSSQSYFFQFWSRFTKTFMLVEKIVIVMVYASLNCVKVQILSCFISTLFLDANLVLLGLLTFGAAVMLAILKMRNQTLAYVTLCRSYTAPALLAGYTIQLIYLYRVELKSC